MYVFGALKWAKIHNQLQTCVFIVAIFYVRFTKLTIMDFVAL